MNSGLVIREVTQITNNVTNASNINYDVTIHTKDTDTNLDMLETIVTTEDYNNFIGDYIVVSCLVGAGFYNYKIKPYSNNLEMTISKYILEELESTETYKAVILSMDNEYDGVKGNYTEADLDKANIMRISFQLMTRELEIIRSLKVDGIYKNTTLKKVLYGTATRGFNSVKINSENIDANINIVEPDNQKTYGHIIIPTGTRLLDLPTFLQDTIYGVYNGDIGVYFKKYLAEKVMKLNLFIFPLYNFEHNVDRELYIYHTNEKIYDELENTYKVVGDIVKIISASNLKVISVGENLDMNNGNAVTSSDPYTITDYNSSVSDTNVTYDKDTQVKGIKSYDREDGVTIENYVGSESNLFKHKSKVLDQSLGVYQVTWNFSNHTLLVPGMVTTLFYQKDEEVVQLKGVLQIAFTVYNESTKTVSTLLNLKLKEYEDD